MDSIKSSRPNQYCSFSTMHEDNLVASQDCNCNHFRARDWKQLRWHWIAPQKRIVDKVKGIIRYCIADCPPLLRSVALKLRVSAVHSPLLPKCVPTTPKPVKVIPQTAPNSIHRILVSCKVSMKIQLDSWKYLYHAKVQQDLNPQPWLICASHSLPKKEREDTLMYCLAGAMGRPRCLMRLRN